MKQFGVIPPPHWFQFRKIELVKFLTIYPQLFPVILCDDETSGQRYLQVNEDLKKVNLKIKKFKKIKCFY